MKNSIKTFSILIALIFLYACSASEESSNNESNSSGDESEIYVFDDVTDYEEDTLVVEEEEDVKQVTPPLPPVAETYYIVQIGAFTTEARAERFLLLNKDKLNVVPHIQYNEENNLYVVQLPPYKTRSDAENMRNQLWKIEAFKDAFIVIKD
ncbi:MAG: SPOR domain-containing protein [Melioribacteraceae bacterium]|nr:SPOR domain-containing protein [Melioribacteraceae bacterium]